MRKLVLLAFIIASFQLAVNAQVTTDKKALAKAETKTELISKLNLSEDKADKIIEIENDFFSAFAVANALPGATAAEQREKSKKMNEAHVARRSKLMELPLTGREMEDVIELSERTRRKHKL